MDFRIAVLPGDGIGPEVIREAKKVLKCVAKQFKHRIVFEEGLVGAAAIDATGDPLPEETIKLCIDSNAVLFGAIGHPKYDNDPKSPVRPEQGLLKLRKVLGLYSNERPVKVYPELVALSPLKEDRLKGVDFIIYRELTGGIYFGEKSRDNDGTTASDQCIYHKNEIERIARLAFEAAGRRRKKVTCVDKANVLETSRLWRETVVNLSAEYKDIELDFLYVDNAAMQLIVNPAQFDVVLTSNMFGDILSDEASVISGSLGLLPSASYGKHTALFEPIHGSYPQAAGQNIANPLAMILSAAMMLQYLGLNKEAKAVEDAVSWTLANKLGTADLNFPRALSTSDVGEFVTGHIRGEENESFHNSNIELGSSTII